VCAAAPAFPAGVGLEPGSGIAARSGSREGSSASLENESMPVIIQHCDCDCVPNPSRVTRRQGPSGRLHPSTFKVAFSYLYMSHQTLAPP
jgi:hypothetical protein